ncbi:MAG: hypothetical protein VCF25_16565 [Candidatus Poribacteria bacterium]
MRGNVKPKKCFPWRERVRYGFDQVAQHLLGTDRLNRWVKSREVRRRQLLERMYARLQSEEPLARRPGRAGEKSLSSRISQSLPKARNSHGAGRRGLG